MAKSKEERYQQQREWGRRNREKLLAYGRTSAKLWRERHPEKVRFHRNEYRRRLKESAYDKLGNRCNNPACQWLNPDGSRGCIDRRCLQIDHVFGGGCKERAIFRGSSPLYIAVIRDNHGRYQLLCANCNWIKRSMMKEHK